MRYSLLLLAFVLTAAPQTLIDNDQVRVLKATDQPHVKTAPHEHKLNRVMVYLNAGKQEMVSSGKTTVREYKAGEVLWSPAAGTHTAEVVSAAPLTMVEIELKKPGDPSKTATSALDPLRVEPSHTSLIFENPQVRVLRVKFGPKEKLAMHEHVVNRAVVLLADLDEVATTPDGKSARSTHKAGEVTWGTPLKHAEENVGGKPIEAVVVELKN